MDHSTTRPITAKWRWHHAALLKERERLLSDYSDQIREVSEPLESHIRHPVENAADELAHLVAIGELVAQQRLLGEIEDAIQRIRNGTYGKCLQTGRLIPAARLRAVPWTRFSFEVESKRETSATLQDQIVVEK